MSVFGRGTLTALLATALSAAPGLAQERLAGKPASVGQAGPGEVTLSTTTLAGDYSKENTAVGIAVAKGKKEGGLTGREIGDTLALGLLKKFDVPAKVFVRESAGDYSNVTFFIKGRLYGPYDLGESIEALALISRDFERAHGLPSQRRAELSENLTPSRD